MLMKTFFMILKNLVLHSLFIVAAHLYFFTLNESHFSLNQISSFKNPVLGFVLQLVVITEQLVMTMKSIDLFLQ